MRRVIYSFYIEIPQNKLVSHHETNVKFIDHKHWLLERQREYAKSIGPLTIFTILIVRNLYTMRNGLRQTIQRFLIIIL